MPALLLTPAGHLLWRTDEHADAHDAEVGRAFERDWREGLFRLAARPPPAAPTPSLRYWKSIGERYLIALCHLPPDTAAPQVAPPTPAELGDWMLAAPPLQGGEYLSSARLRGVWDALDHWTQETLRADGGLERFVAKHAPKWRQVGRVCLHLAENKNDPDRPFAFMATYIAGLTGGLSEGGRLRHLPLSKALEQYAGAKNRSALLRLLTPLQRAAERVDWLRALVAPSLKLALLHPSETDKETLERIAADPAAALAGLDLVVTSYSMLNRQHWLRALRWRLLVLDEAQAIKNAGTQQSKAVKAFNAQARIALTGTPVENHLGDLWSLFDFLNPGLLGSAAVFKSFVKRLESGERPDYAPLRKLVAPYILRRMKTDRSVIADLPPKTESERYCLLTKAQVRLYQQTVEHMAHALETADGIARRGLVLQTLMRLKQICNHPSQLEGSPDFAAADSGKFQRLAEICEELAERQERVLVFTQFREIIDPLMDHLAGVFGRPGLCLHGGTAVAARKSVVAAFQAEDGPPFLVLSLKAGGTGLNLTAASHVIHFDRWWNPAVENQATDRAFRIGQTRHVFVQKLVTQGTIEERIAAMIADKQKLSDELLTGEGEIKLTELPDDQLLNLVRLDVTRAQM